MYIYIHQACTCWCSLTCVCVCLGGGERQHLTFVMVCVCVCVTDNEQKISDAGAEALGKALATNCTLQNLNLEGKCRENSWECRHSNSGGGGPSS